MPGYLNSYGGTAGALAFGTTTLQLATSCADGAILSRSGTSLVGTAGSVQGSALAWHAASTAFLDSSRAWGIATTSTAGLTLANTTAATAGATVQYSPGIDLAGTAWASGGGTSVVENWRIETRPATGASAGSALYFSRSTGGGAYSTYGYFDSVLTGGFYSSALKSNSSLVWAAAAAMSSNQGNAATGHGTCNYFYIGSAHTIVMSNGGLADGANAIVYATNWRINTASITNAGTVRIHQFCYTNNSAAAVELASIRGTGALHLSAANSYSDDGSTATGGQAYGAELAIKSLSAVITIAAAASTTTTVQIPAGAVVLAVSCRVTTVIPVAASFKIGHAGDDDLWGTGISTAATTTATGAAVPALFAAATSILITPNTAPDANTGRVRIVIHYYIPTAPTS